MIDKTKILLVDDEEQIREKLGLCLTNKGYDIYKAENGNKALEKLHILDFNVLITDLSMPEMGGMDLIKKCRVINPKIGIIIITAFGDVDTYIETINSGAFEYLNKPFDLDDLDNIIKKIISLQNNYI